eukprot:g41580.t1
MERALAPPGTRKLWLSVFSQALKLQHDAKDKQQSGHEDAEKKLAELRKEAWLMKEDQGTKTWKSYYMVLSGSMLYCYELNLRGSTPLAEGGGVHADITSTEPTIDRSKLALGVYSESLYSYKFSISVKQRLYSLAADTEEQRKIWMQQIERALARSKSASSAPVRSDQYATAFAQPAPEGEVTFVFTDVQNSTNLWEAVSTGMNKALKIHDSLMRMLLKQFRGYEVKTEGDAFMVTFFNVLDAVRWCLAVQTSTVLYMPICVRWCLAVQTSLLQSSWPDDLLEQPAASKVVAENGDLLFSGIRVRMGIHVGFPNCRRNPITGRMDYFGPTVNRSARVADSAHGGQIICTDEVAVKLQSAIQAKTFDRAVHFTKLGEYFYKGIAELVTVHQILPEELKGRSDHFPRLRIHDERDEEVKKEKEQEAKKNSDGKARRVRSKSRNMGRGSRLMKSSPMEHGHQDSLSINEGGQSHNTLELPPEMPPEGDRSMQHDSDHDHDEELSVVHSEASTSQDDNMYQCHIGIDSDCDCELSVAYVIYQLSEAAPPISRVLLSAGVSASSPGEFQLSRIVPPISYMMTVPAALTYFIKHNLQRGSYNINKWIPGNFRSDPEGSNRATQQPYYRKLSTNQICLPGQQIGPDSSLRAIKPNPVTGALFYSELAKSSASLP